MDIFGLFIYTPLYNLIIALYHLLGDNLGLAIIAVGIIFRLATIPLTRRQQQMAKSSSELQSKLKDLEKKHKGNEQKIKEEQLRLQQEYLPQQLAGCLPMILQVVLLSQIFIILTNIFKPESTAEFNKIAYSFVPHFAEGAKFNTIFLGLDIGASAGHIGYANLIVVLPYILLAIVVGATQFYSAKYTLPATPAPAPKADKDKPEDFATLFQQSTRQTMLLLPVMIGFFSLNLPAGLGIYWTTQSAFVIIQQFVSKQYNRAREVSTTNQ